MSTTAANVHKNLHSAHAVGGTGRGGAAGSRLALRIGLVAALCLASMVLTNWGLQARLFGPAVPEPLAAMLTENPQPVSLSGLVDMNGQALENVSLEGRWTIICPAPQTCNFETGLPAEAIAAVLNRLAGDRDAAPAFQVLQVVPRDIYVPTMTVGDVSVLAVSPDGDIFAGVDLAPGQSLLVDPYGRHFASVRPTDPSALRASVSDVISFLDKEMSARLL